MYGKKTEMMGKTGGKPATFKPCSSCKNATKCKTAEKCLAKAK